MIDDLHLINPLDSDVVAALNWIPLTLPDNVYLIFTTGIKVDQLRLTPVQREKLRNQDCFMELSPCESLAGTKYCKVFLLASKILLVFTNI